MPKFMVTLTGATSMGSIVQCAALTAKLNGKPIATVGDVATYPQASDVLVEGVPGILLNGKPIVCSGGKTAMGACVMPNTCVKVSTPETYVGFAVVPLVDTKVTWEGAQNKKEGSTTDNKEAMQKQIGGEQQNETIESSQNDEPEESENVTFESDFAPNELTKFAKTRGKILFMISMNRIFGVDGTVKAIEKLYDEVYKKPIKNPEFVVCKNKIQGKLDAAYSSETHKIYINEQFLREAVNDNYKRHELMIAIVEEYGHHLDYLIRYVYDNNENKDAEGDEGARFAYHGLYEIFNIDFIDTQETPFGTATIDGTQIELKWEYADVYEALQRCTAHRLEGTDDHYGEFEGFDVTGKKRDKYNKYNYKEGTGANHEKIQQDTFNDVNKKRGKISKDVIDKYIENSRFFYRGNWLRDMSQIFAPIVFRFFAEVYLKTDKTDKDNKRFVEIIEKPDQVCSILTDVVRIMALRHFKDEYTIKQLLKDKEIKAKSERLKNKLKEVNQAIKDIDEGFSSPVKKEMLFNFISDVKNNGFSFVGEAWDTFKKQFGENIDKSREKIQGGYNTVTDNITLGQFKKGIDVLRNMYSTAEKEFKETMAKNFNWRETFVDGEENGLIPGLGQALGVSVTHDHCDNPKGLTKYPSLPIKIYDNEVSVRRKMDEYYGDKGFLSDDVADNATEVSVDRTNGIKHNLKSTEASSKFAVRKTVVENVAEKLSKIKPGKNLTKKDAVVLGGALHTLQDFYAHSNYCEVYLSKYFKSVITWTAADYENVNRSLLSSNNSKTVFRKITNVNNVVKINRVSMNASDNTIDCIRTSSGQRVYKKPFYAPITSGTCDMEDLLVCGMHLLDAKLDTIFYDLEEKMINRREEKEEELKPHQLTLNDIAIFALLEIGKEIAEANEARCFEYVAKTYYGFILLRETKVQLAKEIKTITDPMKKRAKEMLMPELFEAIKKDVEDVKTMFADLKTYLMAILVKIALLILLNILEQFKFKDITKSTLDILNLMSMSNKPSEISFKFIHKTLEGKYGPLKEGNPIYHSPLGRLYNGEDPSHTVLAKDSDVHPINDIAGQLATATSVEVLIDHMREIYLDEETAKKNLGKYIAHPLLSNIYDDKIRDWAYSHPQNVIKASLTVCVLERMYLKFIRVMIYKKRIHDIDNRKKQDTIYVNANRIMNLVMRGIEQVDLNKLGKDLKGSLKEFKNIFDAYFKSMYFELDARSFVQFTEDFERLEEQKSKEEKKPKKIFVTRTPEQKKVLMDKWKTALKKNVADFLNIKLTDTNDDPEVQLRIPLLADLNAPPKKESWLYYSGILSQDERKVISAYSINLLNKVATRNRVRITMTCSIKKISPLALGANSPWRYHCVSEAKYAQVNVIDLQVNGDLNKKKAVIQDLLNSGVVCIIQKDFPNVKEFSYKPTQKLTYMKNEPCIHVEIKQ